MRRAKCGFGRIGDLGCRGTRWGRGRLGARIHLNAIGHALIGWHQKERQEYQQGNRGVKKNFVTNHSCFQASKILQEGNASWKGTHRTSLQNVTSSSHVTALWRKTETNTSRWIRKRNGYQSVPGPDSICVAGSSIGSRRSNEVEGLVIAVGEFSPYKNGSVRPQEHRPGAPQQTARQVSFGLTPWQPTTMETCAAIKRNGEVCGRRRNFGQEWCGTHLNVLRNNPQARLVPDRETIVARRQRAEEIRMRPLVVEHLHAWNTIRNALLDTMGLDMGDFDPNNRVIRPNAMLPPIQFGYLTELFVRVNLLVDDIYNRRLENPARFAADLANRILREAPRPGAPPNLQQLVAEEAEVRELERFVRDKQNVHREAIVQQTKDIIDRVLRIPVPEEYKSPNLKTMGEVLLNCPMTKRAASQFSSKYCSDEDIYDYGPGIYARVCDSVWQYIKNSPSKQDLCKIFVEEMEDNVGMCAQGNLTRLCNVLTGYMEGVGIVESTSEQLQRRMALLMDVEDPSSRVHQGRALLEELHIPNAEWNAWLEALA